MIQCIYAKLVPLKPWTMREQEPHQLHVDDPVHYSRDGNYLWWGM